MEFLSQQFTAFTDFRRLIIENDGIGELVHVLFDLVTSNGTIPTESEISRLEKNEINNVEEIGATIEILIESPDFPSSSEDIKLDSNEIKDLEEHVTELKSMIMESILEFMVVISTDSL